MGSIGRNKIKETYIIGKENINKSLCCKNCPCHIYNNSGIIRYGKGNLVASNIIVLPPYKTEDLTKPPVEEELLQDILSKANIDINDCYITRAIKCYSTIKNINYNAAYYCFNLLVKEIKYINPKNIILFGREVSVYYNNIRKIGYNGKIIILPTFMIKFYDEVSYEHIIKSLIREYND